MQSHVDRFLLEAERRGRQVDISKLSFEFENDLTSGPNRGLVVATCTQTQDLHLIQIDTTNTFWIFGGEMGHEEVVFHELGHCILDRPHTESKLTNDAFASIMRAQGSLSYGNFNALVRNEIIHRRDYYLDELLDETTSAPCWADDNSNPSFPMTLFQDDLLRFGFLFPTTDQNNQLWFVSQNQLYRSDQDALDAVSIDFEGINALTRDQQGNIWVAGKKGDRGMIGTFVNDVFQIIYEDQQPLGPLFDLRQFLFDQDDHLWFFNDQGSLWVEDTQGVINEIIDQDNRFLSRMALGPDGAVLVVRGFDLQIYQNSIDPPQILNFNNSILPPGSISDLITDGEGVVWIITQRFQGAVTLVRYRSATGVEALNLADVNMPDTFAQGLAVDGQGVLWLASSNGLKKWEGSYFSNYCLYNAGSPILSFSDVVIDAMGNVWGYGEDATTFQKKLLRLETGS